MPNTNNFEAYAREYADAAGLKPTDMPSSHHPLLESDEDINTLSDLIDARSGTASDLPDARGLGADEQDIDVDNALTFPRKARPTTSADRTPTLTSFEADARGDDEGEDDSDYMTRAEFESDMDDTDPDPNASEGRSAFIGDAGIDRAPDITGTVTGIARGMSTHLPQDLGADGFQILEPEDLGNALIDEDEDEGSTESDPADGDRIPVTERSTRIRTHDDALDATRQLV